MAKNKNYTLVDRQCGYDMNRSPQYGHMNNYIYTYIYYLSVSLSHKTSSMFGGQIAVLGIVVAVVVATSI